MNRILVEAGRHYDANGLRQYVAKVEKEYLTNGISLAKESIKKCSLKIFFGKVIFVALLLTTYYAMFARMSEMLSPVGDSVFFSILGVFTILYLFASVTIWAFVRPELVEKNESIIAGAKSSLASIRETKRELYKMLRDKELKEMGF